MVATHPGGLDLYPDPTTRAPKRPHAPGYPCSSVKGHEKGATAVEYGLLVGLVALVLVGSLVFLDGPMDALVTKITNAINGTTVPPVTT